MDININFNIVELAKAEIARAAANAYSEEGSSLYDGIRVTSRDDSYLANYRDEAMAQLVLGLSGRASWSSSDNGVKLTVNLVDSVVEQDQTSCIQLLKDYLVSWVCAEWFKRNYTARYEEYHAKAMSLLENAINLIKMRKSPSWTKVPLQPFGPLVNVKK